MIRPSISLIFLLAMPSVACAQQPEAQVGGSPLCVWEIYSTLLAYAEVCDVDRGSDRRAALEEAVDDLALFIRKNSDIQQSQLDDGRLKLVQRQRDALAASQPDHCEPSNEDGIGAYYRNFADMQSPDELRAWIAKYTSSPRSPYDGGCL
jgi:hypothetical protein